MVRLNEKLSSLMETLSNIMAKKGDHMKSRAYKKANEAILSLDRDINDVDELKDVAGIGASSLKHMREYLEKGTLDIIEAEKNNPENILSDIYGVGPKKAKELVEKGITSIADLRKHKDELLNKVQKVGLQYYEDILERIPRTEIDKYNEAFKSAIPSTAKYEIVGSYRRGAADSGDIDVIITSDSKQDYQTFIDTLISKKIILEVLSRGDSKCLVITRISTPKYARRVDFLYTSPQEYPFAVLYFTGSKGFNTVMRGHALKHGYSLNEHGLTIKSSGEKVSSNFTEEKDIFDFLDLQYKSPSERIDGRAVIPKIQSEKTVLNEPILEDDSILEDDPILEVESEIDVLKKKLNECNTKLMAKQNGGNGDDDDDDDDEFKTIKSLDRDYQKYIQSSFYKLKTKCASQPNYKTFDSFHTIVELREKKKSIEETVEERSKAFKLMLKNYKKSMNVMKKEIQNGKELKKRMNNVKKIIKSEKIAFKDFISESKDKITEISKEIKTEKQTLLKAYKKSLLLAEKEKNKFEADSKKIEQENALLSMEIADLIAFIDDDDELKHVISEAIDTINDELKEIEAEATEAAEAKTRKKMEKLEAKEQKKREVAEAKTRKNLEKLNAKEQKKLEAEAAKEQKKRDAEAAKEQKKLEAEAAKEQKKLDAEAAKEQKKREVEAAKTQKKLEQAMNKAMNKTRKNRKS